MVNANNVAGHRQALDKFSAAMPADEALKKYVGGTDVHWIGFIEREVISRHHTLEGADIIDVGCGIGRLTRYVVPEPVRSYLGTDILPEVLAEAQKTATGDRRFRFEQVSECAIPAPDASADIVCAFSVMTHLLDNEVYAYFAEASRVLRSGGVCVYSFLDFALPYNRAQFLDHFGRRDEIHDVLKFFERDTLRFFAEASGLEVVEFVSPSETMKAQREPFMLPGGKMTTEHFRFGRQSLIFVRKP